MPTLALPTVPLTIAGKEYKLAYDFNAIADAEERLLPSFPEVNLLRARWAALTAFSTRVLFEALFARCQPELSADDCKRLTGQALTEDEDGALAALNLAYGRFVPKPKDGDDIEDPDRDPTPPGN